MANCTFVDDRRQVAGRDGPRQDRGLGSAPCASAFNSQALGDDREHSKKNCHRLSGWRDSWRIYLRGIGSNSGSGGYRCARLRDRRFERHVGRRPECVHGVVRDAGRAGQSLHRRARRREPPVGYLPGPQEWRVEHEPFRSTAVQAARRRAEFPQPGAGAVPRLADGRATRLVGAGKFDLAGVGPG